MKENALRIFWGLKPGVVLRKKLEVFHKFDALRIFSRSLSMEYIIYIYLYSICESTLALRIFPAGSPRLIFLAGN